MQPEKIPFEWHKVSQLLESVDLRNELITLKINALDLPHQSLLSDLINEFGSQKQLKYLSETYHLIHFYEIDRYLFIEPAHYFNKYRLISLRSEVYDIISVQFDLLKFKSFCRTKQEEALKSGLQKDAWHNKSAEQIFGLSEEPGYLGGKGSSNWKYTAFCNLVLDIYADVQNKKLIRVSPYDTLLNNGKMMAIQNLYFSSDLNDNAALISYISRKLGSPIIKETKGS